MFVLKLPVADRYSSTAAYMPDGSVPISAFAITTMPYSSAKNAPNSPFFTPKAHRPK
jgi:hypothetical protein